MPITKNCERCGQPFTRPPSIAKRQRFCSPTCFYEWLEEYERAEYLDVKCLNCGKQIHILASRYNADRGRYCSQECMIEKRPKTPKGRMIQRKCFQCGKAFETYPSWVKKGEGKFCSRSCTMSHTNARMRKNSPTTIEVALWNELNNRGIEYVKEYFVNKWLIDVAFPAHMLAVEADGVYWHSLENVKEKDSRKDKDLQRRGWTVLHFTGDEIRDDVSKCVDKIVAHLSS